MPREKGESGFASPQKQKVANTKWAKNNPESVMYSNAKQRALREGIPFTIEVTDIKIPTHCAVTGVLLVKGKGTRNTTSPSLDKVIPKLGYVKGNVRVISGKANLMKGNLTLSDLHKLQVYITEHLYD